MTTKTEAVVQEILAERVRQDTKWGEQNHPDGTGDLMSKIFREKARELCDAKASMGKVTWMDILTEEFYEALAEEDQVALRKELIQVAAVAAGWVEKIDRDIAKNPVR